MTGASAIHINIFGLNPVVVLRHRGAEAAHAAAADRGRGQGLLRRHRAQRRPRHHQPQDPRRCADGDAIVVNGRKIWTSTAQVANKILLLARTTPKDRCKRQTDGLTLFYTDLDRTHVEVRAIHKMGRHAVDSNMVFIDDLRVPVEDRIGEEGQGFRYILHGLNPERVLVAAEADRHRPRRPGQRRRATPGSASCSAAPSARTRASSTRWPKSWAELEAANLMVLQGRLAVRHRPGLRRRGQRRQIPRRRGRLRRLRDRRC